MKIELNPGEKLTVAFAETDGEIILEFTGTKITVTADLPDSSGRHGVIYEEDGLLDLCPRCLNKRTIGFPSRDCPRCSPEG